MGKKGSYIAPKTESNQWKHVTSQKFQNKENEIPLFQNLEETKLYLSSRICIVLMLRCCDIAMMLM
jgi:hypothetical protein